MNMRLQRIKEGSRAAVNTFIRQNWFDIKMEILSLNSLNEVKGDRLSIVEHGTKGST